MKQQLFSVYDNAAEAYKQPFFMGTVNEAKRLFEQMVNDPQTQFYHAPGDFTLFHLAEMDIISGEIETFPIKKSLANGVSCKRLTPALSPEQIQELENAQAKISNGSQLQPGTESPDTPQ